MNISIHAPSRERRKWTIAVHHGQLISIHAPSRERPTCLDCSIPQNEFQSTLPRGSDYRRPDYGRRYVDFNPRSLAGATAARANTISTSLFQSTLPRGSDCRRGVIPPTEYEFQSTLPRGSDQLALIVVYHKMNFNPRSLAGATYFS